MPRKDDNYRYGPKNQLVDQLDRDRDLSGVRGYPSDKEYMKTVGDAKIERQQNRMSVKASQIEASYEKTPKEKIKSFGNADTAKEYKGVK